MAKKNYRESELAQFRQQKYTEKERAQEKLSTFYLGKMKQLLVDQSLSIKKRIMDNELHGEFVKKKTAVLEEQWNAETEKKLYTQKEIEQKIKDLKNSKDKRESIKARVITETLRTKQKTEREINQLRKATRPNMQMQKGNILNTQGSVSGERSASKSKGKI